MKLIKKIHKKIIYLFLICSCIIFSEHDLVSDADYIDHIQHHEVLRLGILFAWKFV